MNLHLSSRFAASVLPLLATCALLPGLNSTAAAAEVNATFTSATTAPVTAASYVATGNTVYLSLSFAPPTGTSLTVVNNTGMDLIAGAFGNLAQDQTITLPFGNARYRFTANYFGGTGNDLVLEWGGQTAYGWGYNASGQLGNGGTSSSSVPVAVTATGALAGKFVTATAGTSHNFALGRDGTVPNGTRMTYTVTLKDDATLAALDLSTGPLSPPSARRQECRCSLYPSNREPRPYFGGDGWICGQALTSAPLNNSFRCSQILLIMSPVAHPKSVRP